MCYYNGQKVTKEEYIRLKHLEKLVAHYNFLDVDLLQGPEYSMMSAVLKPMQGKEDFDMVKMEWGFIPRYIKTREEVIKMRKGYIDADGESHRPILTLNAMAEELLLPRKIYRQAALERRCLVLSTGFFEWRHIFPISKRTGQPLKTAIKYPYFISLKDKGYFYMAGIWQPWTDTNTGEHVDTFAIVTTEANELMEQVHNTKKRMPTILNVDLGYEWMFGKLEEERITEIALTQYPSVEMQAWSINKDFKNSLCPTDPFQYYDLPPLGSDGEPPKPLVEQVSLF